MVSGMRTGCPCELNKGLGSKFRDGSLLQEGSCVRQEIPEGRRAYRPKRCTDNNEDADNNPTNTIEFVSH